MNILMIGCGKLGLPCAEVLAEHYKTIGYDIAHIPATSIEIEKDLPKALKNSDVIFIAVPTPHDRRYGGETPALHLKPKDFNYKHLISTIKHVQKNTTKKQTIVIISTVLPGTIRKHISPYISENLIYNPYLIAMGTVKNDMRSPDCLIIGNKTGKKDIHIKRLLDIYQKVVTNKPPINIGTWEEAESIKIFYNTFISLKLSFVNMIQDVAQTTGNMNVDVVVNALKTAKQRIISTSYMTPGLGDGGACHPRDNIALRYLSKKLKLGYDIFQSVVESRELQAKNIANFICNLHKKTNLPVVMNGMSYKQGVKYTDGSYSLLIDFFLREKKCKSTFIDPLTNNNSNIEIPSIIFLAHSAKYAADLYSKPPQGSIIIDPWRTFKKTKQYTVIYYGDTRNKNNY